MNLGLLVADARSCGLAPPGCMLASPSESMARIEIHDGMVFVWGMCSAFPNSSKYALQFRWPSGDGPMSDPWARSSYPHRACAEGIVAQLDPRKRPAYNVVRSLQ